jgi:hypothetical protein
MYHYHLDGLSIGGSWRQARRFQNSLQFSIFDWIRAICSHAVTRGDQF